jgi:hypothetical protein
MSPALLALLTRIFDQSPTGNCAAEASGLLTLLACGVDQSPTRKGFCRRKGISEAHYFNLKARGEGPRELQAGRRIIITPEAEAEWDQAHQIRPKESTEAA